MGNQNALLSLSRWKRLKLGGQYYWNLNDSFNGYSLKKFSKTFAILFRIHNRN